MDGISISPAYEEPLCQHPSYTQHFWLFHAALSPQLWVSPSAALPPFAIPAD